MKQKGASNLDKAIWTMYENISHIYWHKPYEHTSRYLTYYAEEGLYLVADTVYHGFYFMKADSPKDAVSKVSGNKLERMQKGEG
jgi:hypothetical protein